jgi:hypothetical protein
MTTNAGEDVAKQDPFTHITTMGSVWRFLKNLEIELPYDPVILLLGIYTNEH